MGNHTDLLLEKLTNYMVANPRATINDCCRALTREGVPSSKALVAKLRKAVIKAARKARDSDETAVAVSRDGKSAMVQLRVPIPPTLGGQVYHDPKADEAERAEAKEREHEREEKWQARAAEREREWAEQRAADERATREAIEKAQVGRAFMEGRPLAVVKEAYAAHNPEASVPVPVPVRRGAANRALRRQYLNELLDADPGADPLAVANAVKQRFGIGLDWGYIYDTCRVAREVHKLPQIRSNAYGERSEHARPGLPEFEATGEERAAGANPEEDVAWLMRQLRDVMRAHGLASMTIAASEDGASWEFTEKPREPRKASGEVKFA